MAVRWGFDETNGVVIGAILRHGKLFVDGRPQGETLYGETESDVETAAKTYVAKLRSELGEEEYKRLFPAGFELRIYN